MALRSIRAHGFKVFLAGLSLAAAGIPVLAGTAQAAHSSATSGATCAGSMAGPDYSFVGSGFTPGAESFVTIGLPGGGSFVVPTWADASGHWYEYWYPDVAGTYTAQVSSTHWAPITSCSLNVG